MILAAPAATYGTPEWLAELRVALFLIWVAFFAIFVWENRDWLGKLFFQKQKPVVKQYELCKLHSRPIGTCPPGSHDQEGDS